MTRLALTLLAALLAGATPADTAPDVAGVYRMVMAAQVAARPLLQREEQVRGDAVLSTGAASGQVQVRLLAIGHACTLAARLAPGGDLAFAPGQRCLLDLDEEGARGRMEAQLISGSGRAAAGRLALELRWSLSGTVRLLDRVPGLDLALPGQLAAEIPISGEARASGEGKRDESRAGGG